MKSVLIPFALAAMVSAALANTAPTPVIVSAAMRSGTTFMDVVYRVNDPDDATVKVRALAFVDGVRSFAKVLRPVTFVEGTASKIGDSIASNTNHTLTWDVGADWNIDLGQLKFEILCRDARGLLAFDWITIPAAAGNPAMTISKDAPTDASILSALFWQYASADTGLTLSNGVLRGSSANGIFSELELANGVTLGQYAAPFIFKRMNLAIAEDVGYAINARAGLLNTDKWHAANKAYEGLSTIVGWGYNGTGPAVIPPGVAALSGVVAIAAGSQQNLALRYDGTVVSWGNIPSSVPAGLSGVTAIAASGEISLALKSNGTVVSWKYAGGSGVPAGLTGVTAIAAGDSHGLALKSNGTVVGWLDGITPQDEGQAVVPAGLTGVTKIAAGRNFSLALKSDGTVVGWGENNAGQATPPAGLTGVIAIAAGHLHSLALKSDGTVVAWGDNVNYQQTTVPAGLNGVIAIAAGDYNSLALKSDGTVVVWGSDESGQSTIPAGLTGVSAIAGGYIHSLALKTKAP